MIFALAVLILFIILALILIVLLATGTIQPQPVIDNQFQARIAESASLQAGFGMPQPVPCTSTDTTLCRGECLLYETFSTELNIVDNLTPIANLNQSDLPTSFTCLDGYTQALQKQMATCNQEECIGRSGERFTMGQSELFYVPCGNLQPCSNTFRSAVILQFSTMGTEFNRMDARCVTANVSQSPAQFTGQLCPNQTELNQTDEAFLNVVQQPITGSSNTLVQIRAPLTGDCLLVSNGEIVSGPCLSQSSDGFEWIYLSGPITIPTLLGGSGRIYPPQILFNSQNLTSIQTQLASLLCSLNSQLSKLSKELNRISGNDRTNAENILGRATSPIQNGDRNQLKSLEQDYKSLEDISPVFEPARKSIEHIVDIYDLLGVTGSSGFSGGQIQSLQVSDSTLILQPIGSCPQTTTDCRFNTVIVSSNAYMCAI